MKFFTVFTDDWSGGTADLDAEHCGAFWNICVHYMGKDGEVPDDDRMLARIARVSSLRRWRVVKATLIDGGYIEIRDGFLVQRKCDERLKKDGKFEDNQRKKANKRWGTKRAKALANNKTVDAPGYAGADARADASPMPLIERSTSYYAAGAAQGAVAEEGKSTGKSPSASIPAPPLTPDAVLWSKAAGGGLGCLIAAGVTEGEARRLLGRWRRDYGDAPVLTVITAFVATGASDARSWIPKALRKRHGAPGAARSLSDFDRFSG